MKGIRKSVLLIILLALMTVVAAEEQSVTLTQLSKVAISNWQALAFASIIFSAILVAVGAMVGTAMEIPEMKAWAGNEMAQVFANTVLVLVLIGTIIFLDTIVMAMVNESGIGGLSCQAGDNCLKKVANAYLDDYINMGKEGAKNVLQNNMDSMGWANRRFGLYCISLYCAQFGITTTFVAHYMLDADRYTLVFEYYSGILSSLEAQKFFVNEIGFTAGPLILSIGIIMRAFFFTRRTGGLLIAIAAGVMFFLPAMYIFDWMTLDLAISGDKAIQSQAEWCPAECKIGPPLAYYIDDNGNYVQLTSTKLIYENFTASKENVPRDIILGKIKSGTTDIGKSRTLYSCQYTDPNGPKDDAGNPMNCSRSCRELPYQYSNPTCANHSMEKACNELAAGCKITRIVQSIDKTEYENCPSECRIIPPLKPKCSDSCIGSRYDCRVTMKNDTNWRPQVNPKNKQSIKTYCDNAKNCEVGVSGSGSSTTFNANNSCVWIMPQYGSCEEVCKNCAPECRVTDANNKPASGLPSYCLKSGSTTEYSTACKNCPSTCMIKTTMITAKNPPGQNCSSCQVQKRVTAPTLPADYTSGGCDLIQCPKDYRVALPSSACESCLFSEEAYMYEPPINMGCGDLCKPPENAPSKSSGEYTQIDSESMVGKAEIKAVSKLMIPAYLLPLFNIAATLIFIKGVSGLIGGDLEIPGIQRLF